MNILVNAFGISDSGGITVLERLLEECKASEHKFYVFCMTSPFIDVLIDRFEKVESIYFMVKKSSRFVKRFWYENILFKQVILDYKINLVYNFTGSYQPYLKVRQLVKIQNLLFYTKQLDQRYFATGAHWAWFKQVWLKRQVFLFLIRHARFFDIQSAHVESYLEDFISVRKRRFFIKSDIALPKNVEMPKHYDFSKEIHLLYIVGPHFEYLHKNMIDFVEMVLLLMQSNTDFQIDITLTKEELHRSSLWDKRLDPYTNFIGYIADKKKLYRLFDSNKILVSTSVIETIGLHVVEAILHGVLSVVPAERYAQAVYGNEIDTYSLYNPQSLLNIILDIISRTDSEINDQIQKQQKYIIENETSKYQSIIEVFDAVVGA